LGAGIERPIALTKTYFHFHEVRVGGEVGAAWQGTDIEDEAWDVFLQRTPLGEYVQSSIWARAKSVDGWKCHRVLLTVNQEILGGFQLLWRSSRFGKIGYVSRGPVAKTEDEEITRALVDLMKKTSHHVGLRAMIVQPPGRSQSIEPLLSKAKFCPNGFLGIVTANLMVDVSDGWQTVEGRMRRTTRQQVRKAIRNGISIREGGEKDLGIFFDLMLQTCKRQRVRANPSSLDVLTALMRASEGREICRLTLAEYQGRSISGLFCIAFGEGVTLWKKGSLPEFLHLHPVEALYQDAMLWAHSKKYRYCDFAALDRRIAEALIKGATLSSEQRKGRDIFNLGFGGNAVLLPEAYLYFPNPLLAWGYRRAVGNNFCLEQLKEMAGKVGN
jgi:hypothetical protein